MGCDGACVSGCREIGIGNRFSSNQIDPGGAIRAFGSKSRWFDFLGAVMTIPLFQTIPLL
jgi:hypothetical protein